MNARGPHDWMLTYTGKAYWPLDPKPEDICIEDIAHALAMLCRYAGQTRHFYCVSPETKILTYDFRWVPVREVNSGEWLWGFDEHHGGHRKPREWKPSLAVNHGVIHRPLIRLEFDDGTVLRCSEEHPLLSATKQSGNTRWITASEIYERLRAGRYTFLPKFLSPWKQDDSYNAGWLAGMFDGEGSLSSVRSRGASLHVAQNEGKMLERLERLLSSQWAFSKTKTGRYHCKTLTILGGAAEQLRLLGTIRPTRLIEKMQVRLAGRDFVRMRPRPMSKIVSAKRIGIGEVVALETSTHTYIAEGYGSHNSVAEHSWHVSYMVPPELALEGLLHDASEAYLCDVVRPVKQGLPDYKRIERLNEVVIRTVFGLPHEEHPDVKAADTQILVTEHTSLLPPYPESLKYVCDGLPDPMIDLKLWHPVIAEEKFLERFYQLTKGA